MGVKQQRQWLENAKLNTSIYTIYFVQTVVLIFIFIFTMFHPLYTLGYMLELQTEPCMSSTEVLVPHVMPFLDILVSVIYF